ncbi:hypothetical protein ACP70R_019909 [Stipagrostis hirtigluma subsp. patula]
MSSPLVTGGCIAVKSKHNGKFLRYMPAHGRILQMCGDDAKSPFTRFHVEPSKKHGGHVHIRCCYNNMYWVAREVNREWRLYGDANEPQEDLTHPSCTLFRPGPNGFNLQHARLKRTVYMLPDAHPNAKTLGAGCMLLGNKDKPGQDAQMLSVINLTVPLLPEHICFKGDNGKYLSCQDIEGHNYLQFSSTDIGDPTVRHTALLNYYTYDSYVIRSDYVDDIGGMCWRLSPNWIWADTVSAYAYSNNDCNFRVRKVGDKFALQNLGNNNYCMRLSTEGKWDCLNAAVPTIPREAQLRLEELVLSRRIYGIEYDLKDARVYGEKVLSMDTQTSTNRTGTPYTAMLNLRYSVTTQKTWSSSASVKLAAKITITAGPPQILSSTSIEIQSEITESYTWGETESRTEEKSVNYEVRVPAYTKVTLTLLATQGTCDVPFSYYQEDVLTDGQKVVTEFDDGIYRGVNSYNFKSELKEEKL